MGLFDKFKNKRADVEEELEVEFPFYDVPNTTSIICCHIIDNGAPILYVSQMMECGNFYVEKRMKQRKRN